MSNSEAENFIIVWIMLKMYSIYCTNHNNLQTLEKIKAEEGFFKKIKTQVFIGITEEQAFEANNKKIHLDYAVLRYGDFSTLSEFYQIPSYLSIQVRN